MRSVCSMAGCTGFVKGLGLCEKHYVRLKKNGTPENTSGAHAPLVDRFWLKVDKRGDDQCWPWLGTMMTTGYGRIGAGGRGGKSLSAHRVSCEIHHGPPPFDGAHVMHLCDNRACVNPAHLRWATPSQNIQDAYTKKRKASPFKKGESHHMAVLSRERVKFIKEHQEMTVAQLARLFECSRSAIEAVRSGRTWRD